MSNALISYPDRTLNSTLAGGSWTTASALANLRNTLLSAKARTADAAAASSTIQISLANSYAVRCLALLSHNISYSGTVRIRGYSDSGFTTMVTGADTGTVNVWPQSGFTADDADAYPNNWIYAFTSSKTARYWLIEITDTANPDGYIELGRCWIGEAFEPETGVVYGASLGYESRDITEESLGGVIWGEKRTARRSASVTFAAVTAAERNRALIMQKTLGTADELLWIMNGADTAVDMLVQAFPATMKTTSALSYPYFGRHELPMELVEIV